jgi:endonuclease YncB( thermonuclease family)
MPSVALSDAEVFFAQVLNVQDGDSFSVMTSFGRRERIRLAGIDAPELEQPHGEAARDALQRMLLGTRLEIQGRKRDPFGRWVGRAYRLQSGADSPKLDIAREQLRRGHAWVFTRYAKEQPAQEVRDDLQAQRLAQQARLGLWAQEQPQPPWDFRR